MKNNKPDPILKFKMAKKIAAGLFAVSIYLSIKWSDIPAIDIPVFNNSIFVNKKDVDASMLNLATGYFTGYLVYILTVIFPTIYRNQAVNKATSHQLNNVLSESKYLLFLMAKSAMNEKEWNSFLSHSNDFDCFDKLYYGAMAHFDITADAETILKHKCEKENKILKWYEYLEYKIKAIYDEIDDVVIKYQSSMSEELFDCLYELKKSIMFDMILGKSMLYLNHFYTDMDGNVFIENLSISMYCQQAENKIVPIFSINNEVNGSKILQQYISNIKRLEENIELYLSRNELKEDEMIRMFKSYPQMGHIGTARLM